jgi:hypothetical protein
MKYLIQRALAIVAGALSTALAIGIMCQDAIKSGVWTLDHAVMPAIIAITVILGHLAYAAWRDRSLALFGMMSVLLLAGTTLTAYNSVGRQTEAAAHRTNATADVNANLAALKADLKTSRDRAAMAEIMADREMNGQKCGDRCKDWKTRAKEVRSHIDAVQAKIDKIGPAKIADGKAIQFAAVAGIFGFDAAKARDVAATLEQFSLSLFLEMVGIVALIFGFSALPDNAFRSRKPRNQGWKQSRSRKLLRL